MSAPPAAIAHNIGFTYASALISMDEVFGKGRVRTARAEPLGRHQPDG
jgi:hypothetical protein